MVSLPLHLSRLQTFHLPIINRQSALGSELNSLFQLHQSYRWIFIHFLTFNCAFFSIFSYKEEVLSFCSYPWSFDSFDVTTWLSIWFSSFRHAGKILRVVQPLWSKAQVIKEERSRLEHLFSSSFEIKGNVAQVFKMIWITNWERLHPSWNRYTVTKSDSSY